MLVLSFGEVNFIVDYEKLYSGWKGKKKKFFEKFQP